MGVAVALSSSDILPASSLPLCFRETPQVKNFAFYLDSMLFLQSNPGLPWVTCSPVTGKPKISGVDVCPLTRGPPMEIGGWINCLWGRKRGQDWESLQHRKCLWLKEPKWEQGKHGRRMKSEGLTMTQCIYSTSWSCENRAKVSFYNTAKPGSPAGISFFRIEGFVVNRDACSANTMIWSGCVSRQLFKKWPHRGALP